VTTRFIVPFRTINKIKVVASTNYIGRAKLCPTGETQYPRLLTETRMQLIQTSVAPENSARHFIAELPRFWFAVFTRCKHEKRVSQYYLQRRIEHFLPLYRVVHNWTNNRKAILDLPLFPGYLFVNMTREDRLRALGAPGALSLVGCGNIPTPLSDFEIESLRIGLQQRVFEPHPYPAEGARVRVRAGSLAGMEGVVVRKKNSCRVVLTLDLIMQSVAVEVDYNDLEPVTSETVSC
jgi:transcription antitermination factor NusG